MVSIDFINFYDVSNTDVSNSEEELVTEEDNTESKQNPSDYYRSTNVTGSQSEAENDALADDKNGIKIKKKEFRNYLPSADSNGEVDDFGNGRAKLNDLKKKLFIFLMEKETLIPYFTHCIMQHVNKKVKM